jgi:lipopolysaccharide export system protein LptA
VLEAHGTDLFYDARTRLTTLKGEAEMWLLKEGNEIHARELELLDQKGAQQILCRGAGRIHLLDKKSGKRTLHARWKEKFVSSRDGEYDLLTLTGNAAFVEDSSLNPQDVHNDAKLASCKSMLRAEVLQVWLEPRTRGAAPAGKPAPPQAPDKPAEGAGGRKPHHLEATGNVTVHSPEVYIHDTERLFLLFREPIAPPAGNAGPSRPETSGGPAPAAPAAGRTVVLGRSASPAEASTKAPPRPINLKARLVKAYVVRSDTRNELDEMHTEGEVRVFQEPAKREDKGVDIRGDTLRLTRKLGGNYLVVTGDLAQVRMDKLFIIGPEIHIDQSTNTAWVNGTGAMQMETKTDFQGQALAQPMPLEVHWNKRMDFDGNSVEFLGGIQAVQGESRLACELLHVYLDRPVSLKEGNRTGQPARARKLTCDGKVWVEDKVFVPRTQTLAGYRRLDCVEMTVNNDERTSHVHAPGPGMVRIVQPGGSEFGSPGPATPQRQPAGAEEWKLTLVSYFTLMRADNGRRTATFLDDVRLLHVPWDRDKPNAAIDLEKVIDNLPSGGLYLRCDRLTVYSRNSTDRKGQQLDAAGRVEVKATDAKKQIFWGTADNVHYDEEKDQVIFDGGEGGRARLSVIEVRGAPPRTVTGRKIIYLRKKGEFTGDGLTEIRGSN